MQSDNVIPEGWVVTTLSEIVSEVQPGFACGTNNRGGDGVAHLRPMNVSTEGKIDLSDVKYIPAETVDSSRKQLKRGDVLFNNTNSTELVGKTAVYDDDEPRAFSNHMTRVRVREGVLNPRYCAAFLHHCWSQGYFQGICNQHVSQSSVSRARLLDTPVGLPPFAEQERIVAKVEALLERVNKARQRLDRVPEILKQFRQSVLAAACSGRLTADWREECGGVDSASFLAETLTNRKSRYEANNSTQYRQPMEPRTEHDYEYPDEWAVASVDQLTCLVTSGSRGWAKYYSDNGPQFVRAQNINTDELRLDDVAHVNPPETAEGRRTRIETGDLLVTITGANVTKSALVREDIGDAYVSQHVAIARPVDRRVAPFLFLWVISPAHGRAKLTEDAYGAGKPGLNLDNIREMLVALPPLHEQEEIVRRVAALMLAAQRLEQHFTSAAQRTEKVGQAVLAKAFAGELVETEADLAQREGRDYEPASVPLERIAGRSSATSTAVRLERGQAVLDILLLLEAWNQPVSISALEPALVLMRNDAAREVLLGGSATRRRRRALSTEPQFVRGLDVVYSGLVANGAIRRVGQSGFELANSQWLTQASAADRTKAAEVIRAIQTLSDLRSLPQAVASITHEQYEITV
jgi:type I restriction enzyme S subunit